MISSITRDGDAGRQRSISVFDEASQASAFKKTRQTKVNEMITLQHRVCLTSRYERSPEIKRDSQLRAADCTRLRDKRGLLFPSGHLFIFASTGHQTAFSRFFLMSSIYSVHGLRFCAKAPEYLNSVPGHLFNKYKEMTRRVKQSSFVPQTRAISCSELRITFHVCFRAIARNMK